MTGSKPAGMVSAESRTNPMAAKEIRESHGIRSRGSGVAAEGARAGIEVVTSVP